MKKHFYNIFVLDINKMINFLSRIAMEATDFIGHCLTKIDSYKRAASVSLSQSSSLAVQWRENLFNFFGNVA